MQSTATHKYLRIAPRKVRLVADLIKGKNVVEAEHILHVITRGAAQPLEKVLQSAVASAKSNLELDKSNLYVAKLAVDEGPKLKRYRPRARGRAYPIQKKTSHIMLVLQEITPSEGDAKKKAGKEPVAKAVAPDAGTEEQTTEATREKKPKLRATRDLEKPKSEGRTKRIFRRKAI